MQQSTLTKKQLAVIDAMFAGETDIDAVLAKHNVSRRQYNKWLGDENFKAEFIRRIEWLNLRGQAMIARYASLAAAKLVALTDCEKEDVRRKACLDIISLPLAGHNTPPAVKSDPCEDIETLPPATAAKLLEILASENHKL